MDLKDSYDKTTSTTSQPSRRDDNPFARVDKEFGVNPFSLGAESVAAREVETEPPEIPGFRRAFSLFWENRRYWNARASRSEYWFVQLWFLLITILHGVLIPFFNANGLLYGILWKSCYLFFIVVSAFPFVCLLIRRLHDVNLSGRFVIPELVPYVILAFYLWKFASSMDFEEAFENDLNFILFQAFLFFVGILHMVVGIVPTRDRGNRYGMRPERRETFKLGFGRKS